ncbi:hypothetical protein BH11MYX2_BH11MYX2_15210 [soil metagenome]
MFKDLVRLWLRSQRDAKGYYLRHVMLGNRSALVRTRAVAGSRRGRSAFLFATGPSMAKLDAAKVARYRRERGFDVIGINFLLATPFGRTVEPTHYVVSDPAQWTAAIRENELAHLGEKEAEAQRVAFRTACETTWNELQRLKPELWVPLDQVASTPYEGAMGFCDAMDLFSDNVTDITRPLGYRPWTAYKALSIACYLGYERVYLCGVDNDSFRSLSVDNENVKRSRYRHFYDADGEWQDFVSTNPLWEDLYYTALTFRSLEKFKGLPIVNLDPESLVDSFSKHHDLDVYRS